MESSHFVQEEKFAKTKGQDTRRASTLTISLRRDWVAVKTCVTETHPSRHYSHKTTTTTTRTTVY